MNKFEFENKDELIQYVAEKANEYLDRCEIYKSREDRIGLIPNIENHLKAKKWLYNTIFKNNIAHNGKGQLVFPVEFSRKEDVDVVKDFARYIRNKAKLLLEEGRLDGETYDQIMEQFTFLERLMNAVSYINLPDEDITIKGRPLSEYREEWNKLYEKKNRFKYGNEFVSKSYNYYTVDSYKAEQNLIDFSYWINSHCHPYLELQEHLDALKEMYPDSKARLGQKMSKIVLATLKQSGIYDILMNNEETKAEFNRKYASYTDAIKPLAVKRWAVLSINFVDFLTISYGNSWTSCLNTDKNRVFTRGDWSDGFNSRRVLDYALDPSTMVFYVISENYDGDDFELQPKIFRQLFHFGEGKLVQGRLYPQGRNPRRELYDQHRAIVEKAIADGMGEANLWSAPARGMIAYNEDIVNIPYNDYDNGDFIDFLNIACHGGGEKDFQSEVNWVRFKGSLDNHDTGKPMIVGATNALCILTNTPMRESYTKAIYKNEWY